MQLSAAKSSKYEKIEYVVDLDSLIDLATMPQLFISAESNQVAPKCQVKNLYYAWYFQKLLLILCILQAELNMKESQVADLRQNISTQQSATSKAQAELKTALEEMEKLKKDFKADRTS